MLSTKIYNTLVFNKLIASIYCFILALECGVDKNTGLKSHKGLDGGKYRIDRPSLISLKVLEIFDN